MWVQTLFKKCLSWETTSTVVFSKSIRKSSSHFTACKSSPFVGSSSNRISGFPKIACASSTFTFSGSVNSFINLWCISAGIPSPTRNFSAFVSASHPSNSANSPSSSAAKFPSSSVNSVFAYSAFFWSIISYNFACPIITTFSTSSSSYAKWSCFKNDSLLFFSTITSPEVESSSPVKTFKNVDFPAPFGPIIP